MKVFSCNMMNSSGADFAPMSTSPMARWYSTLVMDGHTIGSNVAFHGPSQINHWLVRLSNFPLLLRPKFRPNNSRSAKSDSLSIWI